MLLSCFNFQEENVIGHLHTAYTPFDLSCHLKVPSQWETDLLSREMTLSEIVLIPFWKFLFDLEFYDPVHTVNPCHAE